MENNTPLFSVVIPTKNRPEMLKDAIQSVLLQSFDDFELIVSDNWNEKQTQDVIKSFNQHPKFNTVRTEKELSMINHWEFATKQARGRYVIVLADRKVLYQNALTNIAKAIKKFPDINAFSFGVNTFNELKGRMGWSYPITKTRIWETKELIANFLNENYYSTKSYDRYFPKTLNGCFKNEYAQQIRDSFGHYFNTPEVTTPDYSSFFINCALNDEVVYIGEKIILTQGESDSNGRKFGKGKYQAYMASLGIEDPYKNVSIKAPFIYNLLVIDFETIKRHVGKNLSAHKLDETNYFYTNYYELLLKKSQGITDEDYADFYAAWKSALDAEASVTDDEIRQRAAQSIQAHERESRIKITENLGAHIQDFLALRFKPKSWVNKIYPFHYDSVLTAAGFK